MSMTTVEQEVKVVIYDAYMTAVEGQLAKCIEMGGLSSS